jgi:hypothetical protein
MINMSDYISEGPGFKSRLDAEILFSPSTNFASLSPTFPTLVFTTLTVIIIITRSELASLSHSYTPRTLHLHPYPVADPGFVMGGGTRAIFCGHAP